MRQLRVMVSLLCVRRASATRPRERARIHPSMATSARRAHGPAWPGAAGLGGARGGSRTAVRQGQEPGAITIRPAGARHGARASMAWGTRPLQELAETWWTGREPEEDRSPADVEDQMGRGAEESVPGPEEQARAGGASRSRRSKPGGGPGPVLPPRTAGRQCTEGFE
jgi:hypothetical protein